MKPFITQLGVVALTMLAAVAAHADTDRIVTGTETVTFEPALLQQLAASGGTITDLSGNPLGSSGAATFTVVDGLLDLNSSVGEAITKGGLVVRLHGVSVILQDLIFEVTGQTTSDITATVTLNGRVIGRESVFLFDDISSFAHLPLPQASSFAFAGATFKFTPSFATLVNAITGEQVLSATAEIGSDSTADQLTLEASTGPTPQP